VAAPVAHQQVVEGSQAGALLSGGVREGAQQLRAMRSVWEASQNIRKSRQSKVGMEGRRRKYLCNDLGAVPHPLLRQTPTAVQERTDATLHLLP